MKCCIRFERKTAGLIALSFCIGTIAGLLLPIYIVAIIEMAMLIILGYFCLFKW